MLDLHFQTIAKSNYKFERLSTGVNSVEDQDPGAIVTSLYSRVIFGPVKGVSVMKRRNGMMSTIKISNYRKNIKFG